MNKRLIDIVEMRIRRVPIVQEDEVVSIRTEHATVNTH